MSDGSELIKERGYFRTPLACGLLMGVVGAGFDSLFSEVIHDSFSISTGVLAWGLGGIITITVCHFILLSAAALCRRSWRLVLKALVWSLCIAFAASLLPPCLLLLQWWSGGPNVYLLAYYYVPLFFLAALSGLATARLYGHPRCWRWCAVGSVAAMAFRVVISALIVDAEDAIIGLMANMIFSALHGAALALPVEKLERKALVSKERAL